MKNNNLLYQKRCWTVTAIIFSLKLFLLCTELGKLFTSNSY